MLIERLELIEDKDRWVKLIINQREILLLKLKNIQLVKEILPCDANFLMVRFDNPRKIFKYLVDKRIIVRDRSNVILCEGCLRLTIGTSKENEELIEALRTYKEE